MVTAASFKRIRFIFDTPSEPTRVRELRHGKLFPNSARKTQRHKDFITPKMNYPKRASKKVYISTNRFATKIRVTANCQSAIKYTCTIRHQALTELWWDRDRLPLFARDCIRRFAKREAGKAESKCAQLSN